MTNQMQHTDRNVSAKHMTRIEGWASRKPCIALMGEFSAGKTTLINFLLGEDALPTRVTVTQLSPVWMSHGDVAAHYMDETGRRHDIDPADLHQVPVKGVRYIRLFSRSTLLETMDLLDTPGISDPNIPRQTWEIAAGYVNAVIWCTHSTQAWRESERSAWDSLPARLRPYSLLLATRADKLSPHDRARVIARLKREAGTSFRTILPFSATDAIRACAEAEPGDLWVSSGAQDLLRVLNETAETICAHRQGLLARYHVVEDQENLHAEPKDPQLDASAALERAGNPAASTVTSATIHDMSPRREEQTEAESAHSGGPRVLPNRIARPNAGDSDQRRARLSRDAADSLLRVVQPDGTVNGSASDMDQRPVRVAEPAARPDRPATVTSLEPLILRNRLAPENPATPAAPTSAESAEGMIADEIDFAAFATDLDQPLDLGGFEAEFETADDLQDDTDFASRLALTDGNLQGVTEDYEVDDVQEDPLDVSRLIQDMARDAESDAAIVETAASQPSAAHPEGSALHLWRTVVARAPQAETVPDVLAMIEGFLNELDARGALRIHSAA